MRCVHIGALLACILAAYLQAAPLTPTAAIACPNPDAQNNAQPVVAIIIDDLGYRMAPAQQLLSLPHPLTLSIIPFTPYSQRLAGLAYEHGREVMVHAPMETLHRRAWESALNADMDRDEMTLMSQAMLDDIPHARGLNNHGGSLLTQRWDHMNWLMQTLEGHGLYFVDSRTTPDSIAEQSAWQAGIKQQSRDIFLDNQRDPEIIARQLDKLEKMASRRGHALAIGHPYPETIAVLAEKLPEMEARGVRIVTVSELIWHADSQSKLAKKTTRTTN